MDKPALAPVTPPLPLPLPPPPAAAASALASAASCSKTESAASATAARKEWVDATREVPWEPLALITAVVE